MLWPIFLPEMLLGTLILWFGMTPPVVIQTRLCTDAINS